VLVRSVGGPGGERRLLLDRASCPLPPAGAGGAGGTGAGGAGGTGAGGAGGVDLVNAGGWGVYRVGYAPGHLEALAGRLEALDPLERGNLFSDTWALALAGRTGLDDFLSLAARLGDEEDPSTFSVVAGALGLFDRVVAGADRPQLEAAARALLGPRAASLGWEPRPTEGERVPTLRALLVAELGTVGADPGVREEAARRFDAARSGGPAVHPDLEAAVLRAVAAQCRPGDYEAFLDRYRHPATPQEELRYLMTLAAFPDAALAVRSYELAVAEVRTQNAPYLIGALLANRVGGPPVWERVKADWGRLVERFPLNSHSRMVDACRALCGDRALADDVAGFLRAHPLATAQRSVTQMLERLDVNVAFGEQWRDRLGGVLGKVGSSPSG
ncbi:MAG: ERAP1-like C-terminal domain-containing protein, partial [Acidimicrobiales bacterium]